MLASPSPARHAHREYGILAHTFLSALCMGISAWNLKAEFGLEAAWVWFKGMLMVKVGGMTRI